MPNVSQLWRPDDGQLPGPLTPGSQIFRSDILKSIENYLASINEDLKRLSLDIHRHPELGYKEFYAHDRYTEFLSNMGFNVTKQYELETAWLAEFKQGSGGRTIGINSEMDALPAIGHACGHNLIGMSGVAVACALRHVLMEFDISGRVLLLGTPAEEGGSGKVKLIEKGAYKEMDICLMCHPAPGPIGSVSLSSCLALQRVEVEYFGHTAHAALSPWEATNAQDAAVLGYNNISALRQQLKPTYRVHGIIQGRDWAPNIIPDYAKFSCYIRTPNKADLELAVEKVLPCFEAAGLATGCKVKISKLWGRTFDLRQNQALGEEVSRIVKSRYGTIDYEWGINSASTDFGNVTYELPSLHPGFAIPSVPEGGNHTREFTEAAASSAAHEACMDLSKALAATGVRVLLDNAFFKEVTKTFKAEKL